MQFINKITLAESVKAQCPNLSFATCQAIVSTIFDKIRVSLINRKAVRIAKFGVFSTKKMAARVARNPKTAETFTVPTYNKIKFNASKVFKIAAK